MTFFDALSHFCKFLGLHPPEKPEHTVATQMAINALTSCMKRQCGCKYCDGTKTTIPVIEGALHGHTAYSIEIDGDQAFLVGSVGERLPIGFCPICGRDFKGSVEPKD